MQKQNFVQAIQEGLRDLEEFRKRQLERRALQAHSEAVLQERKAKKSLIELEDYRTEPRRTVIQLKCSKRGESEGSFINAWDSERKEEEDEQEQLAPKSARPQTHMIRRKHVKSRINENQNLIPQLKNLLKKLESPERQSFPNQENFNIQLKRELSSRRKHTIKVADIMKLQDNNWMSAPLADASRPLQSAQGRLNLNPPTNRNSPMLMNQRSCNKFEQEVAQIIRRKRKQQSRKQHAPVNVISLIISKKTTPRGKDKKPRDKLTLIELLQ